MNQAALKKSTFKISYPDYNSYKNDLKLINAYLIYIYKYISNYRYFDEDDCHEFILYFYPTLKKAISNFHNKGIPFEHYLSFLLSRRIKTYLRNKLKNKELKEIEAYLLEINKLPPSHLFLNQYELDLNIKKILAINSNGKIENKAACKRLLFYVAKKANELTMEDIELISHLTDYKNKWLYERISELKQKLQEKIERLSRYHERKNKLFCKIMLLEKRIIKEADNARKETFFRQLKKTNANLKSVLIRIDKASTSPSHREIAYTLGVPKGTVDTSLYRLKNLIENV